MRFTLFTLFILISFSGLTQTPLYKNFTTEDGLPTNVTYSICQDSIGYIWIGTESGLTRFDGEEFKTFTIEDGLTHNVVLKVLPGSDNKIWAFTYPAGLCYYKDGVIKRHPISDSIKKGLSIITNFYEAADGSIYYCLHNSREICLYKDGRYYNIERMDLYKGTELLKYVRELYQINDEYLIHPSIVDTKVSTPDKNYSYDKIPYHKLDVVKTNGHSYLEIPWTITTTSSIKTNDGGFLLGFLDNRSSENIGCRCGLIKIINDTVLYNGKCIHNYPNVLLKDNKNNLLVACTGELLLYKDQDIFSTPTSYFQDYDIGCIIQDKEENYWFTTTQNGLYLVPNFNIHKTTGLNNQSIRYITTNGKCLIVNTEGGDFYSLNTNNRLSKLNLKLNNTIMVELGRNNNLVVTASSETNEYRLNNNTVTAIHEDISGGYYGKFASDTYDYYLGNIAIDRTDNSILNPQRIFTDTTRTYGFHDLYVNRSEDTFWIASLKGLITYTHGKLGYFYRNPIIQRTNSIRVLPDSRMVVSTKQNGIIIRNADTNVYITTKEGLASNIIHNIFIDGNNIWTSTGTGLSLIKVSGTNYSVKNFDILSTRTVGKINHILKFNGYIYLGTSTGLCSFKEEDLLVEDHAVPLVLTSLSVNNKPWSFTDSTTFKRNQNNVEISFKGFSYRAPTQIKYKYLLEGYSEDTLYTANTTLQYTNLPYGDYTFKVFASIDKVNWSSKPASYTFTILPHFTETWWFILLAILGGLLIVSSVFLLIIRNLKRRNEVQKELLLLEQKALRAQMNPHFTFNALNSIQYFITDNNKRAATTFLSKFSKLVRNILNNSKTNTISLADEISTLTTYLELEQMRFNGKIEVDIRVDEDIITDDIFIPSMIIQPFLENAIWHGIMPKEEGMGKLDLDFKLKDNTLICTIKDNGIGRERSAELKQQTRKGHQSTGLKNIEDRIAVLNHIHKTQIRLEITDLYQDNSPLGTMITVYFELEVE